MSVQSSILNCSSEAALNFAQATGGAIATQTPGKFRIFAVNANQDVFIKFGNAAVVADAGVTSFRIPANQTLVFGTGADSASFSIFNNSGSTANISIQFLNQF